MSSFLHRTSSILDKEPASDFIQILASLVENQEDFHQLFKMLDSQIVMSTLLNYHDNSLLKLKKMQRDYKGLIEEIATLLENRKQA